MYTYLFACSLLNFRTICLTLAPDLQSKLTKYVNDNVRAPTIDFKQIQKITRNRAARANNNRYYTIRSTILILSFLTKMATYLKHDNIKRHRKKSSYKVIEILSTFKCKKTFNYIWKTILRKSCLI